MMAEPDGWERDERCLAVDAALEHLGEHFEAVVILATYHTEDEGTITITKGRGNMNTRIGMADHYIRKEHFDDDTRFSNSQED